MSDLIANSPDAQNWIEKVKTDHSESVVFGKIVGSVIWSDATGPDGQLLVPIDPIVIVEKINTEGLRLLKAHDPGFPVGRVLAAASFTGSKGESFVAAVLGLYDGKRISFRELVVDTETEMSSSTILPALGEGSWINFGFDPRHIEPAWVEDALQGAPLPVRQTPLSHNAADNQSVLIVVGVLFVALVFKPFLSTVATEAGKDCYAGIRQWVRDLLFKLSKLQNPILELQSFHDDCQISFMFREGSVKRQYAAHDALPDAAGQAQRLLKNIKRAGFQPRLIVYEFHPQDDKWFPSYAELNDGRFVTDNNLLISIEQLPTGLSLGMAIGDRPLLPSPKRLQ